MSDEEKVGMPWKRMSDEPNCVCVSRDAKECVELRDPLSAAYNREIDKQTIDAITGALHQQETYTQNAVHEVMRLRKIIGSCKTCRGAANAPASPMVPDKPGKWWRLVETEVFVDEFGHLSYKEDDGSEVWLDNAKWGGPCEPPKEQLMKRTETPVCEWCGTELRCCRGHTPPEDGTTQVLGWCSKCNSELWSKPIPCEPPVKGGGK